MISHRYKCVFVHQRKCAGTSIMSTFDDVRKGTPEWHFGNEGVLSPEWREIPRDYLKIAVVRNPWDRFVSAWKFCPSTRDRELLHVLKFPPNIGHDYRHLTRPQYVTLLDEQGEFAVDHLLRFEDLQHDFAKICALIGKPKSILPKLNASPRHPYTMPGQSQRTRPKTGDYHYYFDRDPESKKLFLERFGRDVEIFRYTYD